MQTTTHEATELYLYAIHNGDLYGRKADAIIENLARHMARGTYDASKAPQAWSYYVEDAARGYATDHDRADRWAKLFPVAVRREVADLCADYYSEHVTDRADEMKAERDNRKRWTLAAIRKANTEAGFYFFSADTLRHFGETMASFTVICDGGAVFVVRKRDAQRYPFNPATGNVGPALTAQDVA